MSKQLFRQLPQSSLHQKFLQFVIEPSGQFELHFREEHCDLEVKLSVGAWLVSIGGLVEEKSEGGL